MIAITCNAKHDTQLIDLIKVDKVVLVEVCHRPSFVRGDIAVETVQNDLREILPGNQTVAVNVVIVLAERVKESNDLRLLWCGERKECGA